MMYCSYCDKYHSGKYRLCDYHRYKMRKYAENYKHSHKEKIDETYQKSRELTAKRRKSNRSKDDTAQDYIDMLYEQAKIDNY